MTDRINLDQLEQTAAHAIDAGFPMASATLLALIRAVRAALELEWSQGARLARFEVTPASARPGLYPPGAFAEWEL